MKEGRVAFNELKGKGGDVSTNKAEGLELMRHACNMSPHDVLSIIVTNDHRRFHWTCGKAHQWQLTRKTTFVLKPQLSNFTALHFIKARVQESNKCR